MTHDSDRDPRLHPDDARLVERVAEAYRPREMTPSRIAAFDATLRERLPSTPWSRWVWLPVAAAAGLALWLAVPETGRDRAPSGIAAADPWVRSLLLDGTVIGDLSEEDASGAGAIEGLPEDYAAIESLLLDS